jgi:hypothetical protein
VPVRTKTSGTLPRDERRAMRRLKRHGLGAVSARGVAHPLEVGRDGRLHTRVTGALAVDAFGRLALRTGDGFEQVPGSPIRLQARVTAPLEIDPRTRAMRLAANTIARLLPEPPREGDLFTWQADHLRPYREGTAGHALRLQADGTWKAQALPSVVTDHGGLTGLADDDHPQYRPHMVVPIHVLGHSSAAWASMPAADTFLFGNDRHATQVDLSQFTQARLVVKMEGTAGAAGATLALRYVSPFSATVGDYLEVGDAAPVELAVDVADTLLVSAWEDMASGALGDVALCVVGYDGDGAASPAFGNIYAQFRRFA